jgi:response regulator RpfG family c-di-GMP phosphodiesterase
VHTGTRLIRKLACEVGRLLELDDYEQLAVDVCARVGDIGMIGLPDYVILNADVLSAGDQALLNRQPVLGPRCCCQSQRWRPPPEPCARIMSDGMARVTRMACAVRRFRCRAA